MLNLKESAIEKFKEILNKQELTDYGIRIYTTEEGCCGPSLAMDIAENPLEDDTIIPAEGIKVYLAKEADSFLSNATIEFDEFKGFIITGLPQSSCCS